MNEDTALLQFKSKPSKSLSEADAIAQFITIPDSEKCAKCHQSTVSNNGTIYPDKYFDAPWGKPQVQVCESCFDGSIKASQGFY